MLEDFSILSHLQPKWALCKQGFSWHVLDAKAISRSQLQHSARHLFEGRLSFAILKSNFLNGDI